MGLPKQSEWVSPADYLAAENDRPEGLRHEYVDGQVYAMVGATRAHNRIALNVAVALRQRLRDAGCQVFGTDMKVRVAVAGIHRFYYPDAHVTCAPEPEPYFDTQPCLIVEVLSESTERTDRTEKLAAYKLLPSLREYLLLAQDVPRVEIYRRSRDWQPEVFGAGERLVLESVGRELEVDELYA